MSKPFIVVTSRAVEALDDDELRYILGHELGHLLSGHAVYRTMMVILDPPVGEPRLAAGRLDRAARHHRRRCTSGGARPSCPPTGPGCSPGRTRRRRCART